MQSREIWHVFLCMSIFFCNFAPKITNDMKRISLLTLILCTLQCLAFDVCVEGIYYNVNSADYTASVTKCPNLEYQDKAIEIPLAINYNETAYMVRAIEDSAFYYAGLTSVVIPNSIITIGQSAFEGSYSVLSVDIPKSVQTIGEKAFDFCCNVNCDTSLEGCPWGARCINGFIEDSIVYNNEYKTIICSCPSSFKGQPTIPASVTKIGDRAFMACWFVPKLIVPNNVQYLGARAFSSCYSMYLTLPDDIHVNTRDNDSIYMLFTNVCNIEYHGTIDPRFFTSYRNARCLNGVVDGNFVFTDSTRSTLAACQMITNGNINIPEGVKVIKDEAIFQCVYATSINIPSSVEIIDDEFNTCIKVEDVYVNWLNEESIVIPSCYNEWDGYYAFRDIASYQGPKGATLHVPTGMANVYRQKLVWQDFGTIVEDATPIEEVRSAHFLGKKVLMNGKLLIKQGDKFYSILGLLYQRK